MNARHSSLDSIPRRGTRRLIRFAVCRARAVAVLTTVALFCLVPTAAAWAQTQRGGADCSNTSIGETPLTEMGDATYQGFEGGLYPGGANSIPDDHQELGLMLASHIGPLDQSGEPAVDGKIGLAGVGVSTTGDIWEAFMPLVAQESEVNPQVVLVNGRVSGHPISSWLQPTDFPWGHLLAQTSAAGLTPAQVQVAWVMLPDRHLAPPPFPEREMIYRDQLQIVLRLLKETFPNLIIAYVSSHHYAGYGTGNVTEPGTGYEHGFGVKWAIESQILGQGDINPDPREGALTAPWIAWGPYMWADGLSPRADGLTFECSDYGRDGTHPSDAGALELATMLLQFFMSEPTATPWFLGAGVEPAPTVTTAPPITTTTTTTTQLTTTSTNAATTTITRATTTSATAQAQEPVDTGVGLPLLLGLGGLAGLAVAGALFVWRRRGG